MNNPMAPFHLMDRVGKQALKEPVWEQGLRLTSSKDRCHERDYETDILIQ